MQFDEDKRKKTIIRTSIIGIMANILLAAFKAGVGFFSNSIAIVLDAVNNLSDALSSVITIVGARVAGREPDKKHPFGHGRVEYISALAALVFVFSGISLEAYLGALISLAIIKAGIEMLSETVSKLLGEPGDIELLQAIKATVRSFPQVKGAYDLILHNYGPDTYNGSVHIEVEDNLTVTELDELNRAIAVEVYKKHNVILTAIGVYSIDTKDPEVKRVREEISARVLAHEHVKQIHGFYYNKDENSVRFDVVIGFDAESRRAVCDEILKDLESAYPGTKFNLAMDIDYGEICKNE